ncbi:MAG: metallophosphoesterase [Rubrivivax sp.]
MIRLLHTADWQIGRTYGFLDADDAAALAEARVAAAERIAQAATEGRADAVLVAGDVFDAQALSPRSIRRLFHALAGYAGPWVMIAGNHDAALTEGVWAEAQRLAVVPPNVHLMLQPSVLELPDLRLALLGAPLTQRHTPDDGTAWFDHADTPAGWLRVGLAHGAVQGLLADELDAANPIAPDRAARARLDYLALGDWHGTRRIDDRTWYSGTPEPDRFKDNASGQVLWVELDDPGAPPRVQPQAVAQYRWRRLQRTLATAGDVDALRAELADAGKADVLQLVLQGTLDLAAHQALQQLLDETQARVRSLLAERGGLRLAPTADDIAALQAEGYLGALIAELRDTRDGPDAAQAQDALALLARLLAERRAQQRRPAPPEARR